MENRLLTKRDLAAYLKAAHGAEGASVRLRPITGGLDSLGVVHATARFVDRERKRRTTSFIIKRLAPDQIREAHIYRHILQELGGGLAPSLFWVQEADGECRLYLEEISSAEPWPWGETDLAAGVLRALASMHQAGRQFSSSAALSTWNYEQELGEKSERLLEFMDELSWNRDFALLRKSRRPLERVISGLPKWRGQLFAFGEFKSTFIHGDVHPGNVLLSEQGAADQPVLVDWGRGRVGSPLEDVSSWLQSLRAWEPEARRRHDTLLQAYLQAHEFPTRITRDLRDAYWLAAASNYLGGAILYHLVVAADPAISPERRYHAFCSTEDCLRVIRRADACLSGAALRKRTQGKAVAVR